MNIWNSRVDYVILAGHQGYEGNERADNSAKLWSLKTPSKPEYDKTPFRNLENIIEEYYQNSIITRYKYSDITAKIILSYSPDILSKLINMLPNHNNLKYHMTRAKQWYYYEWVLRMHNRIKETLRSKMDNKLSWISPTYVWFSLKMPSNNATVVS